MKIDEIKAKQADLRNVLKESAPNCKIWLRHDFGMDILSAIGTLLAHIEAQQREIDGLKAERDAAIEDIHSIDAWSGKCIRCKSWNGARCSRGYTVNASFCNDWQWRGRKGRE